MHGIAFNRHARPDRSIVYPLSSNEIEVYPRNQSYSKGLSDLQAAIDSEEAIKVRNIISSLSNTIL